MQHDIVDNIVYRVQYDIVDNIVYNVVLHCVNDIVNTVQHNIVDNIVYTVQHDIVDSTLLTRQLACDSIYSLKKYPCRHHQYTIPTSVNTGSLCRLKRIS